MGMLVLSVLILETLNYPTLGIFLEKIQTLAITHLSRFVNDIM